MPQPARAWWSVEGDLSEVRCQLFRSGLERSGFSGRHLVNAFGSVRVPAEPPSVLAQCGTTIGLGGRALYRWSRLLRRQVRAAKLATADHCFGIEWSGHMTPDRVRCLLAALPDGTSEVYFHPATRRDAALCRLMPDYEHEAELATLLDRTILATMESAG